MEGDYNRSGFETTSFSGGKLVYIHCHQADYLQHALISSGFQVENSIRQDYPEQDGSNPTGLIFIAKKYKLLFGIHAPLKVYQRTF